jgi:hypothetical protein
MYVYLETDLFVLVVPNCLLVMLLAHFAGPNFDIDFVSDR